MGATSLHFSVPELACHHCGVNDCTQALVDTLETFRSLALYWWPTKSRPMDAFPGVFINDAYRCPAYNALTPNAAKNSVHMLGLAADIRVPGMPAAELEAIARSLKMITGIGRGLTYLHFDIALNSDLVPRPAAWCYDRFGVSVPYYSA